MVNSVWENVKTKGIYVCMGELDIRAEGEKKSQAENRFKPRRLILTSKTHYSRPYLPREQLDTIFSFFFSPFHLLKLFFFLYIHFFFFYFYQKTRLPFERDTTGKKYINTYIYMYIKYLQSYRVQKYIFFLYIKIFLRSSDW